MNKSDRLKNIILALIPVLSVCILLALWAIVSRSNPAVLPTFESIGERFVKLMDKPIKSLSLAGHIWASLKRVFTALIISWVLGISFGFLIGWKKTMRALFGSIFNLLRPIPPIAWIPLIIMWCGVSETGKIIIVFIGAFTPVVINTSAGVMNMDPIYYDVGRIFHGSQRQILLDVVLPTALPSILAGMKISVSAGWTVVLAAEMLGAVSGIGFLVQRAWGSGDMPLVFICIICIGVIGALLAIALNLLERWLCPWIRKSN